MQQFPPPIVALFQSSHLLFVEVLRVPRKEIQMKKNNQPLKIRRRIINKFYYRITKTRRIIKSSLNIVCLLDFYHSFMMPNSTHRSDTSYHLLSILSLLIPYPGTCSEYHSIIKIHQSSIKTIFFQLFSFAFFLSLFFVIPSYKQCIIFIALEIYFDCQFCIRGLYLLYPLLLI